MSVDVPNGWSAVSFGDLLADAQNGCGVRRGDGTPVVVLRLADVGTDGTIEKTNLRTVGLSTADASKYSLEHGDLLAFRVNGSRDITGQVIHYAGPVGFAYCDHFIRFRLRADLADGRFVAHAFRAPSIRRQVELSMVSSAGQNTVSQGSFRDVRLTLPPLAEQQRIVSKLDSLQSRSRRAREALDAVPALLEKLRQSILASAFRGDLTKDWRAKHPDVEPATELLKRIRFERRKKWEESELAKLKATGKVPTDGKWKAKYAEPAPIDAANLPELPDGWCWAALEDLLIDGPSNGFSPKSDGEANGTLTLRLSATTRGHCVLDETTTKRTNEHIDDDQPYWLSPGDLLLQRANTIDYVGVTAIFNGPAHTYIYPDLMMRLRATPMLGSSFIWRALSWNWCRKFMRERATGTAGNMPKVNGETVRRIPIPVPPLEEQRILLEALRRSDERQDVLARLINPMSEQLQAVERSVLAKAFRGELVPQDPSKESVDTMLSTAPSESEDRAPASTATRKRAPKRRAV